MTYLETELVWQDDGHLTEPALTAIADGETSIIPPNALEHLEACDPCHARLGEALLLAASTQEAFGELRAPARLPWPALAVALVLAALGALPLAWELPLWLRTLPSIALRAVPMALHGFASLFGRITTSDSAVMVAGWCISAVVLAAFGFVVAKLAPREIAWKGVER